MKARIKATGEIISLDEKSTVLDANPYNFNSYEISELEILYENTNFPKDYWQKLEHQYAGMAMQGLCANYNDFTKVNDGTITNREMIAENARLIAHALVEKIKEADR